MPKFLSKPNDQIIDCAIHIFKSNDLYVWCLRKIYMIFSIMASIIDKIKYSHWLYLIIIGQFWKNKSHSFWLNWVHVLFWVFLNFCQNKSYLKILEKKVFEKEKMTRFARSKGSKVELVAKELNHLAAILHVYARGLNFMK